ncbi:hypothetical protein L873DRAFT_1794229 [Choiromyces venosus 120613-1]|uniref:Uncharacterized protein n=1 Tax=Choiromyces venosus 120613-1 TaxID=1336337 RepID=A0A3N4J2S4_9PEZI|nr:hypothetical protein L873DRAFT_1794229 [Choiromyces venosus 120613-1]
MFSYGQNDPIQVIREQGSQTQLIPEPQALSQLSSQSPTKQIESAEIIENYEAFKTDKNQAADRISKEVYHGLNKLYPYYEGINDILRRDKGFTPFYVSESGVSFHLEARNSAVAALVVEEDELVSSQLLDMVEEGREEYPPVGGSKNPRKRGSTTSTGKKAIKKEKISTEEELFGSVQRERLALEKERLQYEIQQDEA